jgi:colicin import membrane protein
MDGARHDAQAATERAEGAEALLAESAATDQDAVGRAQEAERRAEEEGRRAEGLQARVDEMQAHMTQLEELVRAAEERAATDRFEMDETLREKQALEAKLEAAQAPFDERAGDGSEPTAELERQLKEAHEAGKLAIRAAGEARAELELARGELAVAEARVTEAEALAYAEADAARAEVALERQLGEVEGSDPTIGVEAEPNGRRREPAASEAEANGHDTDDEPDEEGLDDEGPSLRFRLARTAANKKGKVADRESMWS